MIIRCEKCGSKSEIDGSRLSSRGTAVRCEKCGHIHAINKKDTYRGEAEEKITRKGKNDIDFENVGEGNWEEFVNISKVERDSEEFKIKDTQEAGTGESGFDWENLSINDELDDAPRGLPKMFEDEDPESEEIRIVRDEAITEPSVVKNTAVEDGRKEHVSEDDLSVDMEVLINNPHIGRRTVVSQRPSRYDSPRKRYDRNRSNGDILSRVAFGVLTIVVFTVIAAASYIILSNMGVIPRYTDRNIEKAVESVIPFNISEQLRKDVVITENRGRWLETRNGPMYVISGTVTNESRHTVNYIKIKTDFISDGQVVYDNVVYAGNTFTENELKSSPLSNTILKLKKKSGNIDFNNPEKLDGLNSNVRPGESIPFYSVFPAAGRMLGLKYNLKVEDYEESP
jgi:predicted Zn finger-like uncharacterized protein